MLEFYEMQEVKA